MSETPKEHTQNTQRTEDDGEPPDEAIEEDQTASLDPWSSTHREKWQRHSELGPNLAPVGNSTAPKPWMPNINPPEFDWCSRWPDIDVETLRAQLNRWRATEIEYSRADLHKENLNDDYQRLFVDMLLKHSSELLATLDQPGSIKPLRLLLLGTAGTGKTTATQTGLQELRRSLIAAGYL